MNKIIELRYNVLRRPWNQPKESASDELEQTAINAYIEDKSKIIACGRLQFNTPILAQIRYMAVDEHYRGKGLGQNIIKFLERKAKENGALKIELQARENALNFYVLNGYCIEQKTFLLWEKIQHYLMIKQI
ncbi:MAG: GNAT family N-acetyltransferase [Bacteroidetes bacterium]|nr:GNAT family N-acetyltransferase [Bacteroidota bacterium]